MRPLRPTLRAATDIALDMPDGSGEPERGSLVLPFERQTGVGHQLVGGELGRLFARQDCGDDVGSEEFQPHDPRCVGGREIFLSGDLVEARAADFGLKALDAKRSPVILTERRDHLD